MHEPFALTARRVVLDGVVRPAAVAVRDGRIAEISPVPPPGWPVRALGPDEILLPALTDTHVHLNEPGRTTWEGVETGTRSAAAGGVTLLVDMPLNSDPVTTSLSALRTKIAAVEGKLHVDLGLWGGVVPGNAPELGPMVAEGAFGFKCFLCHSGIDEFPASTEADLRVAMPILRDLGVPLLVHAELEAELRGAPPDPNPASYRRYLHSRPKEWEDRAVALVARMVEETGCRAHVVHLSSAGALATLREARARGLPLTAETCPHYLGLTADEVPDGATEYKCAPPVRERENRELLWEALRDGTLDTVVTDHSPCTPELKRRDTGDFEAAWGGVASLQVGLRAVWTEARARGFPIVDVARWMSASPARLLGLPERGRIAAGGPADLVVFRTDGEAPLDPATLLHRHPTTPWAGRLLTGEVRATWMRGELVWDGAACCGGSRGQLRRGHGWHASPA